MVSQNGHMKEKCHRILGRIVSQSAAAAAAAGRPLPEEVARLDVAFYWMWRMTSLGVTCMYATFGAGMRMNVPVDTSYLLHLSNV